MLFFILVNVTNIVQLYNFGFHSLAVWYVEPAQTFRQVWLASTSQVCQ